MVHIKMKWLIIISVVLTAIYLVMVYFDWDRLLMLKFTPLHNLIQNYKKKPQTEGRVVLILDCPSSVCMNTLKTILDQSVRVHDIAIQTNNADKFDPKLSEVASFHLPDSQFIREGEVGTIMINIKNGEQYPYGAIETEVEKRSKNS